MDLITTNERLPVPKLPGQTLGPHSTLVSPLESGLGCATGRMCHGGVPGTLPQIKTLDADLPVPWQTFHVCSHSRVWEVLLPGASQDPPDAKPCALQGNKSQAPGRPNPRRHTAGQGQWEWSWGPHTQGSDNTHIGLENSMVSGHVSYV